MFIKPRLSGGRTANAGERGSIHIGLPLMLLLALAVFFGCFFLERHFLRPAATPPPLSVTQHTTLFLNSVPLTGQVELAEYLPDSGQSSVVFNLVGNPTRFRATPRSLAQAELPAIRSGHRVRLQISTTYPNVVLALDVLSTR